jgi:hypothetical protein
MLLAIKKEENTNSPKIYFINLVNKLIVIKFNHGMYELQHNFKSINRINENS